MAQWQQIQMLERAYLDQVHLLYANDCLPMEVRQYLAFWIEDQNWSQAAQPESSQACWLFYEILKLLDDEMGRVGVVLGEENCNMVLKHNLRRSKLTLKAKYEDCPSELASVVDGLLRNEEAILSAALANSQKKAEVQAKASVATSPQHNVEERLAEMRKAVQSLKCSIGQLDELQDTFDFRYNIFKMLESTTPSDPSLPQKGQELQVMINKLDCCRKVSLDTGQGSTVILGLRIHQGPFMKPVWLLNVITKAETPLMAGSVQRCHAFHTHFQVGSIRTVGLFFYQETLAQIQAVLGRSDTLRDLLLGELAAWQNRQRQACLGATCNTSLGQLEKWFTGNAEDLFHLMQLLQTLQRLQQGITYERDPFALQLPQLEKRLQEQIFCLLKSAFVVENQPSMPFPNRRPLVLKTTTKFSVRARLLVKLLDRNHPMSVKIEIDRDSTNLAGFRRFNILTSNTKTMEMDRPQMEGLVCDFRHITLKEQKTCGSGKGKNGKGANEGILPVTKELHIISFTLDYCYQGLQFQLQTSTLPVVIISNQMSSAWASILWFIMLSTDPKNQLFFSNPPDATWAELSSVLSCQFSTVTGRDLNADQLKMLREKLCGPNSTSQSTVTWDMFAKVSSMPLPQDTDGGFSFWTWLDGILGLIQEHLLELWNNGLIMGFVSRKRERSLLKKKRTGTFLLRFSESTQNGGITCTWVEHNSDGTAKFRSVEPYTKNELKLLALPDIIHHYQFVAEEDISENPLQNLYPDTPRDEAFGPFYRERQEGDLMEHKKYLNRRLIRVSARQPGETQALEMNGLDSVEHMPLPDGAVSVDAALLPADQLSVEAVPCPMVNSLSNGELPAEPVPLPPAVYLGADELLPNGKDPGDAELLHLLKCLMSEQQDPFLPPPGEEEQQQLPPEVFVPPDEFPELNVAEEDFQI